MGLDKYKLKGSKVQRRLSLDNVPSRENYRELLSYLKDKKNYEYYLWVKVLAGTGARISEFLQFTWDDLISGNFMVRGKGNKYRNFYISKKLQLEISKYAAKFQKSGQFAKNKYGKPITARGVSELLVKWNNDLSLPKGMLHPHNFRHFFAKQFLKSSNNDIVQLAEYLGHENLETTRIYLLKSKEEQMNDFNKFVNW